MLNLNKQKKFWIHPFYQPGLKQAGIGLLILLLIEILATLIPEWINPDGIPYYLGVHNLLELSSIVVSLMVFVVCWNIYGKTISGNVVLLCCTFFAVAMLDFLHTITYIGMPDFLTVNDFQKHLYFWLAARLVAALALFCIAIKNWHPISSVRGRNRIFGATLLLTLLFCIALLFFQSSVPVLFNPLQGLTVTKKTLEYLIIAINLASAAVFLQKMRSVQQFNVVLLFSAVCIMAMSEYFFTLYSVMKGSYQILGHVYKMLAYAVIYRAIVVEVIEKPYRQLQRTQQQLGLSLHASNIALWELSLPDQEWSLSPEWKQQLGYENDELPDQVSTVQSLMHPDDRDSARNYMNWYLASGAKQYLNEYRLRHRDGSYRWIASRGEKQFDARGRATHLLGSHIDISHLKQDEERLVKWNAELEDRVEQRTHDLASSNLSLQAALVELKKTQDQLIQKEKMAALGVLVAGVSHEMNTPLGNGLMVASFMRDELNGFETSLAQGKIAKSQLTAFNGQIRQGLDLLLRNLERAIEQITHFKQVSVDQTSDKRRRFDLETIVADNVALMQPQFKRSPHQINVDIGADCFMDSYPGAIGQVITNLVLNALIHGFSNDSAGLVTISARREGKAQLELTVTDNGKGIAAGNLERIFDPFFTTRMGQGGSGLGLSIVFNLITTTLGGYIQASSEPGKWTTFTILIPLKAPEITFAPSLKSALGEMIVDNSPGAIPSQP